MRLLYQIISTLLSLYELALMAYVVISWLRVPANRWTEMLRTIIEPVLRPIRRLLVSRLPQQAQLLDWSPLVVFLLIWLVRNIVGSMLMVWM